MNTRSGRVRGGGDGSMWKFRACPKCGGDLFVDYDVNGWYEQCLQCGYMHDLKSVLEIKKQPGEGKEDPVLSGHHQRRGATT